MTDRGNIERDSVGIQEIETRPDLQPREALDPEIVTEYAEAMEAGDEFPPVKAVLSEDGEHIWLWDGFHRLAAAEKIGRERIRVDLAIGTLRAAILLSVQANATHGLRRSNADKRKAVVTLLQDPEWSEWSDREIARRTRTSHPFVAKIRAQGGNVSTLRKYRDQDGNVHAMDVAPITEANQARAEEAEAGVDDSDLGMICRTSIDYADYYIKRTNLPTLRAALKYEEQHRQRKTLIDMLENRIRHLETQDGPGGISQEEVKAGVWAYLHDHYNEDDVQSMLTEMSDARQWNNYGSIEPYLDGKPAMRNGIIHAVDEVVGELRDRRVALETKGSEHLAIWQIERAIRAYLEESYLDEDVIGMIGDLQMAKDYGPYVHFGDHVPPTVKKNDLIQAINNVIEQLNQTRRKATVRYESVDVVPEQVESVEVVESPSKPDARRSEAKVTYLPKTESTEEPEPLEEDAEESQRISGEGQRTSGPATIDISLVVDPEAGKFHIEVSERDVPEGTYRGKLEHLHQVLDVALARVWPEAKRALHPVEEAPEPEEEPEPPENDSGPHVDDYVKWGSSPGQHGQLINTSHNGEVGYVRDQLDVIRKFPMHMLTVVQRAAVA